MNWRKIITRLITIPIFFLMTPLDTMADSPFSDVAIDNPHYVAINYLKENGIIDGYGDGTFKSYQKINRAEALKMLTLASGIFNEDEIEGKDAFGETGGERPFEDTPLSAWFTKYIVAAKEKGIISGYDDGTFKPNQTVILAESLKIFCESFPDLEYPDLNNEVNIYADVAADSWFAKYVAYTGSKNIVDINLEKKIFPAQEMTRGYMAEIIYRKLLSEEGYDFGKATFYGAAVQGNGTASGETFDKDLLTAAHKTLPFGTRVEVTNLANGKSIEVKINDRGPYGHGRVIDLSSAAFSEIAWLGTGVIKVQYKITHLP